MEYVSEELPLAVTETGDARRLGLGGDLVIGVLLGASTDPHSPRHSPTLMP